jgi:peptidoglycan hydrolase-like protein with peptidoglycan-binding domain
MKRKVLAVTSLVFGGALVIGAGTGWSQSGMGSSYSESPSGMHGNQASGQWSRDDVRRVQEALKDKGHDPGAIDGVMGPRTQQALRAFQSAQNIQATGHLGSGTGSSTK